MKSDIVLSIKESTNGYEFINEDTNTASIPTPPQIAMAMPAQTPEIAVFQVRKDVTPKTSGAVATDLQTVGGKKEVKNGGLRGYLSSSVWNILMFCGALLVYSFYGINPGIMRYHVTVVNLGPFLVLSATYALPAAFLALFLPCMLGKKLFRMQKLYIFVIIEIGLDSCLIFAAKFTLSVFVQLILLIVPFLVAVFGYAIFKIPMAPFTIPAMLLSVAGGVIALFGDAMNSNFNLGVDDAIGLSLALFAAIFYTAYILFVGRVKDCPNSVFTFWTVWSAFLFATPISLATEDWSSLLRMDAIGWVFLFVNGVGTNFAILWLYSYVIREIGSSIVGTLMPWRLGLAIVFGTSSLLSEELTPLNIGGSCIVMVVLLVYLVANHWKRTHKDYQNGTTKSDSELE